MKKNIWDINSIKDQSGRVAIVTGSSSGIGYEAARVLAEKNATVIIAVRNMDKGLDAAERIRAANEAAQVNVMELDLANLASVRTFAAKFMERYQQLDLLVNNAGVMIPPYGKTVDGFELQMGTNHLGHFALTGLLLERLLTTSGARIVNVSSSAHRVGNIDFNDLHWENRSYKPSRAYGDSKIANLYFTSELTRRLRESGSDIVVTSAHPGWTATDLQRHSGLFEFLNTFMAQDAGMGTLPTLLAAFDTEARGGEFYGPSGFIQMRGYPEKVLPTRRARDIDIAETLWSISKDLTKVDIDEVIRLQKTETEVMS